MTLCNMSIEGGAKSGLVAFDNKTLDYVIKTKNSPSKKYIDDAIKYWETLHSDDSADFDKSCLLYTSPSPRDRTRSRMPSSA